MSESRSVVNLHYSILHRTGRVLCNMWPERAGNELHVQAINVSCDMDNNFIKDGHNYNTRTSSHHQVQVPKVNTQTYSIKSISFQSSNAWNFYQNKFPAMQLHKNSRVFFVKNSSQIIL